VIPAEVYQNIIAVLPILCVDIVVRNPQGEYLVVKRTNEPKKGTWWVIGGRVFKGETLEEAAARKAKEELNVELTGLCPIGYFEAPFQKKPFGLDGRYHAVSIVFSTVIEDTQVITLDSQSSEWKFSRELPERFIIKPFQNS